MTSRLPRATLVALAAALVLGSCSGGGNDSPSGSPTPGASASRSASQAADAKTAACDAAVDDLVSSTQAYVDSYGPVVSGKQGSGQTAGSASLRKGLDTAKSRIERLQCDPGSLASSLRQGMDRVTARGALAGAVRAQLVAAMTGSASTTPATKRLEAGDDLAAVLPTLGPGSTVVLPVGTVRLPETLVLLQGVTLRGQGQGRTTLASAARDTGVLALTDGKVELDRLTLRHTGKAPASLVVAGPSSSLVLTDATVTGAVSSGGRTAAGGTGVLMSARSGQAADRGTTLQVTRTRFEGNDAAGVLLSGGHRASIRRAVFRDNGQCGVCFLDTSSGAVRDSTLTGNGAGVAVVNQADPLLRDLTVSGGQVGIQAGNTSAPVVRHVSVRSTSRAALIFSDRARGRVDRVTCVGTAAGIVVAKKALPYLGSNRCGVQPGR